MNPLDMGIIIWNAVVFLVYGFDKLFARRHMRRIPEKTLIGIAALLSGIGALLGMVIFNHKTSKPKFRFTVPIFAILNLVGLYYWKFI